MDRVSVIIPTLNEAENIDDLLSKIFDSCRSAPYELEVIIVDDASTDGTCEAVRQRQSDPRVRLLCRGGKRGLSSAVCEGATAANGTVLVVMDADLSHPPEAIPRLVAPVMDGSCDMAIGSRYVPGGRTPGWPLSRLVGSRLAGLLAWPFSDVHDPLSGFFAVHRKRLVGLQADVSGFKIGLALLAEGGDSLRALEVPIEFQDRRFGRSKFTPRIIWQYLRQLLELAGLNVSITSAKSLLLSGFLGLLTDLSIFQILIARGTSLAAAHSAGFMTAAAVVFIFNMRERFAGKSKAATPLPARPYLAFLTVALCALFLRGGILAAAVQLGGWPTQAAIFAAVAAGAVFNTLGSLFCVYRLQIAGSRAGISWRIPALIVVGFSLLLRLVYLGTPELIHEEAYYWNYARHLDIGYLDHPPMVAWLIRLGTTVLGNTELAVRSAAFVCWLLTAVFSYGLTRRMFDKSAALRAVLLLSVLPFFFGVGLVMTPDAPLTAAWAGTLYFLYRALIDKKRSAWLYAGGCIGLGMLAKYTAVLLMPAACGFMLVDQRSRRWLLRPHPYMALLIAGFLFSPVIVWNAGHDWASFAFQSTRRIQGVHHFALPELMVSVLLLITPTGFAAAIAAVFHKGALKSRTHPDLEGSYRRRRHFGLVFLLVPLSVFIFFSLSREIKLNWTGPVWLVMLPFFARYMAADSRFQAGRLQALVQRAWPATIVATVLIYAAGLHYLVLGLPGLAYPQNFMLLGWRDLGRQIEQIEDELEAASGSDPLVVGMNKYQIASGLAFYRTRALQGLSGPAGEKEGVLDTTGRHLFGRDSLMYRYWLSAKSAQDRDMILVSDKPDGLTDARVRSRFRKLGDIRQIAIQKNNRPVGRFYWLFAEGYRSD